jgi:hypothetical protein
MDGFRSGRQKGAAVFKPSLSAHMAGAVSGGLQTSEHGLPVLGLGLPLRPALELGLDFIATPAGQAA